MPMHYRLKNELDHMATATVVLVPNGRDDKPTSPCLPAGAAAPGADAASFVYYPWQYLNPSMQATEAFRHDGAMSVIVRKAGTAGVPILSVPTPVKNGASYMLAIGSEHIALQALPPNGQGHIEIVTPPEPLEPGTIEIDWYLAAPGPDKAVRVGATRDVGPGTRAFFEPRPGLLLFLPVPSDSKAGGGNRNRQYSVAEAHAATACPYQPPGFATEVRVRLQPSPAGTVPAVRYAFAPPMVLPKV